VVQVAYELDVRIAKISANSCTLSEFQKQQKHMRHIIDNINSSADRTKQTELKTDTTTTPTTHKEKNINNNDSGQNIIDMREGRAKSVSLKPMKRTSPQEDVSSSGNIQTLLLQQKVRKQDSRLLSNN
jgi:hypothetical protein